MATDFSDFDLESKYGLQALSALYSYLCPSRIRSKRINTKEMIEEEEKIVAAVKPDGVPEEDASALSKIYS